MALVIFECLFDRVRRFAFAFEVVRRVLLLVLISVHLDDGTK